MQILGDATKNLSEEQKLQAFNTIFQRRAMNAAMILAEQGATGFNKYAAAIAALDAENIAAKKLDNLSGDMTILKNSVNALIIQTGMQFQDMLRGWVQGLTGVVQWLRDLDPAIAANVLKVGAFVGVIAGALGVVSLMIGLGIRMYRTFKDLATGVRLVVGGVRLLTASLLTNPLFLFIAALVAIGAAAYVAYQRSETFRNAVNGAFEDIKAVVLPIIDTLKQGFQAMIDAFQFGGTGADGFIGVMEKIGVAARAVYDFFANDFVPGIVAFFDAIAGGASDAGGFVGFMSDAGTVVREFANWMINVGVPAIVEFARVVGEMGFDALVATISFLTEEVFPRIVDAVQETSERVVSAFNWINDNVVPVFTAFGQLIVAVVERVVAIVRFFAPVFQGIFALLSTGFANLVTIISGALSIILNIWNLFKDNLWNAVLIAWDLIRGVIESALKVIQGIIQVITGIISGDWSRVWEGIKNILAGVWDAIKEIVTTAIDLVGLAIQNGLDLIHAAWDTTWTGMSVILRTIWNTMVTIITTFWNTIKGMFSNALGFIRGLWDSTLGALIAKANEIFNQVAAIVGGKIQEVIGFFRGLASQIIAAMVTLGQQLYDFFFAAVGRARNAVELAASGIISFVIGIPGRIISALGDVGSLLYNAGKAIIGGLLNGIKAAFEGVKNFVGGIAGTIASLKGPMQYDKKLLIPAGGWIMGGLMEGMKAQMPALEKMVSTIAPTIQTQFAASTGVTTPTGVTNNHTTDASVSIGEVIIPVKDLEELKTVQEFFNRVGQVARQGVAA
jgi:phage-related protein